MIEARESLLLHPSAPSSMPLARCAALLAADPELAASLAKIETADAFLDAIDTCARQEDIALDADARDIVLQGRWTDTGIRIAQWPLAMRTGWRPFALEWGMFGAELVWGMDEQHDAPFYESDVVRLRARRLNRLFAVRTPLTVDFVRALEQEALPIGGVIFHMSRSGSTLITQALKTWNGVRVLAEPALLDMAAMLAHGGNDPEWLLFRAILAALAQSGGGDSRVVVKLHAWNALACAQIIERVGAPWLFVYRDPVEVLASHAREPGGDAVAGMLPAEWLGASSDTLQAMAPSEYVARMLGAICAAIVPSAKAGNLVNYTEFPLALTTRVPKHFNLDPAACDRERLAGALARHAKRPQERFIDDRDDKQAAADANTHVTVARWIGQHYEALEDIRCTLRHLRIPIACDLEALRADLAAVAPVGWRPHFNREYYSGDWSGVALRAQPHGRSPLYADPTRDDFVDTEPMRLCRYVPRFLDQFECPIESVRFLKLAPGAVIREHRDYGLRFEDGKVRFHVPVYTDPEVEFVLGGETLVLAEGECWYLNFDLPHTISNRGVRDRVHLVIDARVNAWVTELFGRLRAD